LRIQPVRPTFLSSKETSDVLRATPSSKVASNTPPHAFECFERAPKTPANANSQQHADGRIFAQTEPNGNGVQRRNAASTTNGHEVCDHATEET
jgi:hypothetical protein